MQIVQYFQKRSFNLIFLFNSSRRLRHAEVISRSSEDMTCRKLRYQFLIRLLSFMVLIALFTSCGIYDGKFQRGGELTSNFLERIKETGKDKEDYLIEKESKPCSK